MVLFAGQWLPLLPQRSEEKRLLQRWGGVMAHSGSGVAGEELGVLESCCVSSPASGFIPEGPWCSTGRHSSLGGVPDPGHWQRLWRVLTAGSAPTAARGPRPAAPRSSRPGALWWALGTHQWPPCSPGAGGAVMPQVHAPHGSLSMVRQGGSCPGAGTAIDLGNLGHRSEAQWPLGTSGQTAAGAGGCAGAGAVRD